MVRGNRNIPDKMLLHLCDSYGPNLYPLLQTKSFPIRVGLNKKVDNDIEKMKYTAATRMMGYLTGNQCHIPYRMFVLHRNLVDNKWMGKIYNQSEEYQVYSNPKIVTSSTEKIEAVEQCINFPHLYFITTRHKELTIQYRNEEKYVVEQKLFGFRGIVVQHCLDHIDGKLVIDEEVSFGRVKIEMEVQQYFKKTAFLLREYALRLQLHKETQNNSVSTANTQDNINVNGRVQADLAHKKMKEDYVSRIKVAYREQLDHLNTHIDTKKFSYH